MRHVEVGEGHQNHEDDRQDGEHEDAQGRQGQQRFVELVVRQGGNVILGALELLAGGQDLLADLVLTDVHPPGVDEGQDEEDGQNTVKEDEEGVVAILGHAADLGGFHGTQGAHLGQVRASEEEDVQVEHRLEKEEQNAAHVLSPCEGAETHHQEGHAGFPVAGAEGIKDVLALQPQLLHNAPQPQEKPLQASPQPQGDAFEECKQLVACLGRFAQPEKIQFRHAFTNPVCILRRDV